MMDLHSVRDWWSRRRDVAGAAAYWSGFGHLYERVRGCEGAIVLMYHSVADDDSARFIDPAHHVSPRLFERQMAFLRRHRHVVSYGELVDALAQGRTPRSGTVCVTFDDGYRDNLTVAAPILARYEIPALLFVATGYVNREQPQWADVLHAQFALRTRERLALPNLALDAHLGHATQRAHARRALHRHLLSAPFDERQRVLDEVACQLQQRDERPRTCLSWDEVRELRRRFPLFELGGHTRNHIDLRTHAGALAIEEIEGCADDLECETGVRPRDFSFPYGRWCEATQSLVRSRGWRSAVGAGASVRLGVHSDRFALPRAEAASMTALRFKTSGAYPGAIAALGA